MQSKPPLRYGIAAPFNVRLFIFFIHGLPSRLLPLFHKVQLKKPTATEAAHIAIMTKG